MIEGKCLPAVYAFLPRKTETIYEKFLKCISDLLVKPKSITCDFEVAFINACRAVFNDTPIYCCYFHFNQNMIRKIQNIGLTEDYIKNENLRRFLKLPKVLCFIPPDHVEESFLKIRKIVTDDRVLAFFDYFQKTYIGYNELRKNSNRKNARMVEFRIEPTFPIGLWNCYSRLQDCLPRTNNYVEA